MANKTSKSKKNRNVEYNNMRKQLVKLAKKTEEIQKLEVEFITNKFQTQKLLKQNVELLKNLLKVAVNDKNNIIKTMLLREIEHIEVREELRELVGLSPKNSKIKLIRYFFEFFCFLWWFFLFYFIYI